MKNPPSNTTPAPLPKYGLLDSTTIGPRIYTQEDFDELNAIHDRCAEKIKIIHEDLTAMLMLHIKAWVIIALVFGTIAFAFAFLYFTEP